MHCFLDIELARLTEVVVFGSNIILLSTFCWPSDGERLLGCCLRRGRRRWPWDGDEAWLVGVIIDESFWVSGIALCGLCRRWGGSHSGLGTGISTNLFSPQHSTNLFVPPNRYCCDHEGQHRRHKHHRKYRSSHLQPCLLEALLP
jgi:hypothetical protein